MAETFLSAVRFYDTITLSDSKSIKWDTNNIISHNGTQTYLGDATSASTLTLNAGNASFEGHIILAGSKYLEFSAMGKLINMDVAAWNTGAKEHNILYSGWTSATSDYLSIKVAGNSTTNHGNLIIGDNLLSYGRMDSTDSAAITNSATNPHGDDQGPGFLVTNTGNASFAGTIASGAITVTGGSNQTIIDSHTAFSLTDGSKDTLLITNNATASAIDAIGPSIGFGNMNSDRRTSAIGAIRTGVDHDNMGLAFFTHPSNTGDETIVKQLELAHDGTATFTGRTDLQKDLRIRGNDSGGSLGVVRFFTDSNHQLIIDTGNDGANRTVIDGSGNVNFAGNITAAFDSNNSGNRLRIADTEGISAAVRTYSTSDGTGLILNHYYAVSGSPYMRYSDFVSNMGDAAATTMRFLTKPHNGNPTVALTIDNSQNASFKGNIATTSGKLNITSDGSAANGAEIYLKHANNNTTDTIGTIIFGNNADATLSTIVSETNGANNTSNLKFTTSNAGTLETALTLNANNSATFTSDAIIKGDLTVNHTTNTASAPLYIGGNISRGSWNDGIVIDEASGWAATVYKRSNSPKMFTGLYNGNDNYIWMATPYSNSGTSITAPRTDAVLMARPSTDDLQIYLDTHFGGKIGVGTDSPAQKLTVNGAAFITGALTSPGSAGSYTYNGTAVDYHSDGARYWSWGNATTRGTFSFIQLENDGQNQQTAFSINSAGDANFVGEVTVEGKAMINGTSGSSRTALHVMGDDTSPDLSSAAVDDLSLILSNSDAAYGMMFSVAGTGKGYIQQRRISTSTTYDLAIQPYGGKVGIGTDAPAELLDVDGTARMATGIVEGSLYVGDDIQHWGDGGTGVFFSSDTVQIKTNNGIRGKFNNYGLTGDLDNESSLFSGYSVNHQYEGNPQIDHEVFNAYAGAHKWATISLTNVFQSNRTTAWPVANFDQPFLKGGNVDQVYFNSAEDEMVIEIDHSNDPIKYTSFFGIQWTHSSWRANRVKIEVYVGASWYTIVDTTNNTQAQVYGYYASGGTGTTKVKFTLGDPQATNKYLRISKIFATDYKGFSAADAEKTGSYSIEKYEDSSHFNNIYPAEDGVFNLGTSTKRYNQIYSEDLTLINAGPVLRMQSTNNASGGRINIVGLDDNNDDLLRIQDNGTTRVEIHRDGVFQGLTSTSFVKSGGTSSQFLMADGSVSTGVASHNHDDRYYTETESDAKYLLNTTDTLTGDLTITGNLNVTGTSTTVNVEDLNVEQNEITLNYGSGNTNSSASGAGIRIQDAVDATTDATMSWNASDDRFVFSHMVQSPGLRSTASNTFTGGMSSFETTLTNNDDWQNSPISILERDNVGSTSADNKYAPNLNFHWGGRISRSLWMSAQGDLYYGEYSGAGVPGIDGKLFIYNLDVTNDATIDRDIQHGSFGNNNAEFAFGQTVANKVFTYGAEFQTLNSDIQIVLGRNDGTNVSGTGGIGASATNAFHVYDTTSIVHLFQVAQSTGNATVKGQLTCGRILATAPSTGIHQLLNASENSTVLQLITTGDNPDLTLNFQTDHIFNTGSALHIQNDNQKIFLRGSQTTVGTTTSVSGYELTVSNGPGKSIHTSGAITVTTDLEIGSFGLIKQQQNTDVDSAAPEAIASVVKATHTAAFFDYVIKKGTNVRAGVVVACHDGTNVEYAETSTVDLGDTSDVTLSVDISGTLMRLVATTTSNDWSIKSLIRAI